MTVDARLPCRGLGRALLAGVHDKLEEQLLSLQMWLNLDKCIRSGPTYTVPRASNTRFQAPLSFYVPGEW